MLEFKLGCYRFLERKGAGEASVWVRARVRDRAGPCASPGWSGATGSGKRSSRSGRSGAEERLGGEDGADSRPELSVGARGLGCCRLGFGPGFKLGWVSSFGFSLPFYFYSISKQNKSI